MLSKSVPYTTPVIKATPYDAKKKRANLKTLKTIEETESEFIARLIETKPNDHNALGYVLREIKKAQG